MRIDWGGLIFGALLALLGMAALLAGLETLSAPDGIFPGIVVMSVASLAIYHGTRCVLASYYE